MLWIIILIIAAIILYNVIKNKLEDKQIERKIEAEHQRKEAFEQKAHKGDVVAQVELSNLYLEDWRKYNSDYYLETKYYWHWVAIFNGFDKEPVNKMVADINKHVAVVNGTSRDGTYSVSLKVLQLIKKSEERAYRDRTLYKERFPMDVGDNPQVKELHEMIKQWNY